MIIPVMGPTPYLKYDISETVPKIGRNKYKYKELLESPGKNQIIIMGDVINSNIAGVAASMEVQKTKKPSSKEITEQWIKANMPDTPIPRTKYYQNYISSLGESCQPMNKSHFGRILNKICGPGNLQNIIISSEMCYLYKST